MQIARRLVWCEILLALAASGSMIATAVSDSDAAETTTLAHYIVFELARDGAVRPVYATQVRLQGELRSIDPAARAAATSPRRSHDHVIARVRDANHATIFEDVVAVPRWLRGEFHRGDPGPRGEYAIDNHVFPEPTTAFVVRVPVVVGATLELESSLIHDASRFDLDALSRDAVEGRRAPVPPPPTRPEQSHGSPANRVDLLLMGEGYTTLERNRFEADATNLAATFLAITPYREYQNYVNVSLLFTASAQSGADQPRYDPQCVEYAQAQMCCGDPTAIDTTPKAVSTAFNATFCSFNLQRLLTVDVTEVFAAAAAYPDWDRILVLVNSPTYGGSGGPIGVMSTHSDIVNVAQHEYGHSFTGLADEYEDPYPGFPACSDVSDDLPACEQNVTDRDARALVKWMRWIEPAQATPSTGPPPVTTDAGLWEGARYSFTGIYRQGYECLMRYLGTPFCDVAAEAYVLRLYEGGWGVPVDGIDGIEPGSETPAPGSVHLPRAGGMFSATVLGPVAGPDLAVAWRADSELVATQSVPTGGTASYTLVTTPGSHTLELRVTDGTPIVHSTIRQSVGASRIWNVTVAPSASPLCGDADQNGAIDVIDAANVLRAVVLLRSSCSAKPPLCDVDGNGRIDIIDAANVLRRAVALPSTTRCTE